LAHFTFSDKVKDILLHSCLEKIMTSMRIGLLEA
jgi:hypothetical protein